MTRAEVTGQDRLYLHFVSCTAWKDTSLSEDQSTHRDEGSWKNGTEDGGAASFKDGLSSELPRDSGGRVVAEAKTVGGLAPVPRAILAEACRLSHPRRFCAEARAWELSRCFSHLRLATLYECPEFQSLVSSQRVGMRHVHLGSVGCPLNAPERLELL